jgi:ArsR family transcriptional regulator
MSEPAILRRMVTVADAVRCRILRILARHELTVSELCSVLQLPQSTVSRHLKLLADDGWIASRRDGTSRFYSMAAAELPPDSRSLWTILQAQIEDTPAARQDDRRVDAALAGRRAKAREFFASSADQWDRLRTELYGDRFHLQGLLGLLDETWTVGDLGCGTGLVSQAVAPFVSRVVAVDGSAEMLETAAGRLRDLPNVHLQRGELESLPLESESLDAVLLVLVLHYIPDPARVLQEAHRVLRPGGRVLVVDMLPHEHEEYQLQMGHVWLGFSEAQVSRYLGGAGFLRCRIQPLPTDAEARGPGLFAAGARRAPVSGARPVPEPGMSAALGHPSDLPSRTSERPRGEPARVPAPARSSTTKARS